VTYCWKALDKSYNFALDRVAIRGLLAKLCGFNVVRILAGAVSGLPRGSPGTKMPFRCGPRGEVKGEPLAGREATAPSVIREIEKVQGGEEAPRNGNLALPKDVAVKPFRPKGLLNANLMLMFPTLTRRSDGPPGGHVAPLLWPSVGVKPNTWKSRELESSGTPECLELDRQAQNTSPWGVLGVIGKVLKCRCPKWPRIGHLDICSPSYGQKKGRESNCQFDSDH
jgi:hypothetical protein